MELEKRVILFYYCRESKENEAFSQLLFEAFVPKLTMKFRLN